MKLSSIQPTVHQIAQTISSALEFDTLIVDHELIVLGGTGKYARKIGKHEEEGLINGPFLYGRMLHTGMSHIIEDTSVENYDPASLRGKPDELAEICSPIRKDEKILGIIALVALTNEQRERLLKKRTTYLTFIQRMAFLLANLVAVEETKHKIAITARELEVTLSGVEQGILLINEMGRVKYCNDIVPGLLKLNNKEKIIGINISDLWPFSPIPRLFDSNEKFVEHVEITGNNQRLILTALPITWQEKITGAVVYLQIQDANNTPLPPAEDDCNTFDNIVGQNDALCQIKKQALQISQSDVTVLLTGESGTGKELIAKAIHNSSLRKNGPFLMVNCGAIPDNLIESEFFGYEKGAFTGACKEGKPGKIERAKGGTLFLDEIGDLALRLQVKLLHVLENKTMERVGGNKPIEIDVRIIAATNRNLEEMMRNGEFREDLFFRLSVIRLHLPPLRKHKEDLNDLLEHFIRKQAEEFGKKIRGLAPESLSAFKGYDWPGNVRELQNAVAYSVSMETSEIIRPENLPLYLKQEEEVAATTSLRGSIDEQERAILLTYLENGSNFRTKAEVARALNISRTTLYRKLKRLGIES